MAETTDLQRLLVSLEASFTKYERSWQRAQGLTDSNVKQIGTKFDRAAKRIASSGGDAATGLKPVQVQTANIASQFQDIAVQLQSGTSPFTIALQQGTQLTAALGPGAGLRGALSGIAAGFGGLINPVSLATIAIITLGGTAVQWLANMTKGAEEADEVFENHVKRIKQIVSGYEGAEQAVDDYIKKQQQLPEPAARAELTDQQNAALETLQRRFQSILDLRSQFEAFAGYSKAFGVPQEVADQLAQVRDLLQQVAADGKLTTEEVNSLTTAFTLLKTGTDDQNIRQIAEDALAVLANFKDAKAAVESLGVALDNLPSEIAISVNLQTNAGTFSDAIGQLRELAPELRSAGEVARAAAQEALNTALGAAGSELERTAALKEYQTTLGAIAEEERRLEAERASRAGRKEDNAAERERQAVVDLIAALEFESQTLGLSAEQQAVMNALRQAGAAATDEQRARIEELVRANYAEAEAIAANKAAMDQLQSYATNALSGFLNDLRQGKTAAEALGRVFDNLAAKLIEIAAQNLILAAFGGGIGGGNPLGSIIGALFGGGRAKGGPVQPGKIYKVNENTPRSEFFMPTTPGMIIPRMPGAGSRGSSRDVVNVVLQDDSGRMAQIADQRIETASGTIVAVSVARSVQTVRDNQSNLSSEAQMRFG